MSEYLYDLSGYQPLPGIDYYPTKQPQQQLLQQQTQPFDYDFSSFTDLQGSPAHDIQEFEKDLEDLDAELGAYDVNGDVGLPPYPDNSAVFASIRTGTPSRGVPSTFTLSSDSASAYDSGYNDTESAYTQSELSALFNMNFQSLGVDSDASVYSANSPISPHGSPNSNLGMSYSPSSFSHRGSFSDYEPPRMRVPASSTSDYYPHVTVPVKYASSMLQATVSPANVSNQLPSVQSAVVVSQHHEKADSNLNRSATTKDPKRKYQCPNCPRAFARAFNLKTHIQTHDPNRSKPYACQHKSCGRAFSRKHDLTRHLISIHRSDVESVGVAAGGRTRCQECGASWATNGKKGCECDNVK